MRLPRLCLAATILASLALGCDTTSNSSPTDPTTASTEPTQTGSKAKGKVKQKRAPGVHGAAAPRPTEL